MLSSGFADSSVCGVELSTIGFVCGVSPAGAEVSERAAASSEADDSGTGECDGAGGAISSMSGEGAGAAGGAGSLARGALTEVSPVNGFLYSVADVITSTAVGL
jgi:hypothetical protein